MSASTNDSYLLFIFYKKVGWGVGIKRLFNFLVMSISYGYFQISYFSMGFLIWYFYTILAFFIISLMHVFSFMLKCICLYMCMTCLFINRIFIDGLFCFML